MSLTDSSNGLPAVWGDSAVDKGAWSPAVRARAAQPPPLARGGQASRCALPPPRRALLPAPIPAADKLLAPSRVAGSSGSNAKASASASASAAAAAAAAAPAWEEGRVFESEPDADGIITITTHSRHPETSAKQRVRAGW